MKIWQARLAIEKWLWSGGKARTWFASILPKHIADAHYISPRKLRRLLDANLG